MQFYFGKRALVRRLNSMVRSKTLCFEPRPCLCGRYDAELHITYGRYGEYHPVGICRHCGLVYASPYFDEKGLFWFYSSDEYRSLYEDGDAALAARQRVAEGRGSDILDLVATAKKPGATVVEIGCGAGWNLATLQREGYKTRGYEYTKTMVEIGRTFGMDIREGGAEDAEGQFDVVIINHVLEHVPDFVKFVGHLKRLMKPDGVLYIGVPDIEIYGPGQFQSAHCYYFTRRTLAHYMGCEGLFTDALPSLPVAFHGLFRQRAGVVTSLDNEYEIIKARISRRHWWAVSMNMAHHILSFVPG